METKVVHKMALKIFNCNILLWKNKNLKMTVNKTFLWFNTLIIAKQLTLSNMQDSYRNDVKLSTFFPIKPLVKKHFNILKGFAYKHNTIFK